MKHLENFLNKFLSPVANYMSESLFFSTLAESVMRLTPITLGGAVVLLIGNFPIPAWIDLLNKSGISAHIAAAQNATMNVLALLVVFNFAYTYAKKCHYEALSAGLLSVSSFLILMPQAYTIFNLEKVPTDFPAEAIITGSNNLTAFATTYTGAPGVIVAILVGWLVSVLYVYFNKKNLVIKLPASVPPNVSESLRPSILSGLILIGFVGLRAILSLTSFGDLFSLIGQFVQAPLQNFISSPITYILIMVIGNMLWFFGVHPNMLNGIILPVVMANLIENQNAFLANKPLPFLTWGILGYLLSNAFGGTGTTSGLVLAMSRAKSQRYKELFKLSALPTIFNINEPLVFGMPIMMNPIFFLPMALVPILIGIMAYVMIFILQFTEYNPMISLPWTTPGVVVTFLQGGWKFLLIGLTTVLTSFVTWLPFFRIADQKALEEEKEIM
ncbi:PTS sugar transporter subunit IIC [Streptococcus sp. S784/96/1]|uniref:PTS sugar transporter subunit IIC n=1 Tax=Streptococcus sp. S784/96/1 TaxID=2653499 RepID=UPI001386BCDD|nr:PTS transporter subunit EIIC [Streptococcus sp. S784/96/1]